MIYKRWLSVSCSSDSFGGPGVAMTRAMLVVLFGVSPPLRRRRATGRFTTKRGIRQARRPPLAQCVGIAHTRAAQRRSRPIRLAVRLVRESAPKGARMFTSNDVASKCEVRGAVKPARAIARGQASPAGLSRCADLENERQHHQRWNAVPKTANSTSLFGVTWLVLSNDETVQPRPLKSRIPLRENGAVDQKPASLGRWGVFMW